MSAFVRVERRGRVALVEIDHPPVNALAQPVRAGLLAAVESLDADASVGAIVIHGVGRHFVAGADVREFDADPKPPFLNDLLLRLEDCGKPVVAALHGSALGGGCELALASHYRGATRDLQLGLPEIKLGLLPGAGGTIRLPRIVGVKTALEMMTSGDPVGFERAQELGLVDRELTGDAAAAAVAWAEELLASGAGPRRTSERPAPPKDELSTCAEFARNLPRSARGLPAGPRIIEAVQAGIERPFREAVVFVRSLFEACRHSTESKSLRHLFFAERGKTSHAQPARPVERVGVVGAGTMGAGIAISLVTSGFQTVLVDVKPEVLAAGLEKVRAGIEAARKKGRMTGEAAEAAHARLVGGESLGALAEVDVVIEAVFENLAVKQKVFAELGRIAKPGCVLATNTSTLDVDAIAGPSGRVEDVVGMHFFSPANVMRLVEVVRGTRSSPASLATVAQLTKKLGKIGVEVGNGFGFVGNRMLYAYGREKELLLLEGATPEQVDGALEKFGMAMGPNAVGDLAGLDIGWNVRKEWKAKPDDPRFYRVSDLLAEQGRFGQKTGAGFYRYEAGKRVPDPSVVDLIRAEATRLGVCQRAIEPAEIVDRCTLALVDEGTRILEEGIARRAADIDVIWCNGYGYPRTRGGPMFYADTLGLPTVLERIRALAGAHGARFWTPSPLLERLAREGRSFAAYDESVG
jgi:3-hydroxyacyl-CoA dehydrogenase